MTIALTQSNLTALPANISRPEYDRSALTAGIVHIGLGNFHRAHQAHYLHQLFLTGRDLDWAIVGAGVRPQDADMRASLAAQDYLSTVVELDPQGLTATVVGAMIDFLEVSAAALIARLSRPDIRIVSLTITEGGYFVDAQSGGFDAADPAMQSDAAAPEAPETVFGMIIAALRARRAAGVPAFTVMSCDNLPENGRVTRQTLLGLARMIDPDLAGWIASEVAFPNSMVDCITPATSDRERSIVAERFGITDAVPVACEPFRQWVLEDNFCHGRPQLEAVGVEFVSNVEPYELMKLRILNGGHAAIAYPSALLGHAFVHDAMDDPLIARWLERLESVEILPTLDPIEGVDYAAYLNKVIERFSNPEIGDTIPRLCFDGSNRQPKFILPTLRQALSEGRPFDGLALEVALWCRYCAGEDEAGQPIPPNDPIAAELKQRAQAARSDGLAFLTNESVFGDLGQHVPFAERFAHHLGELYASGTRRVLENYLTT